MNILHIMTTPAGGAGSASLKVLDAIKGFGEHRVLYGLGNLDLECAKKMPVSKRPVLAALSRLEYSLARKGANDGIEVFTPTRMYRRVVDVEDDLLWADVLHLHWIGGFHFDLYSVLNELSPSVPVVVTMHDMAYITGGCHYSNFCTQYQHSCRKCPQLPGVFGRSLIKRSFALKTNLFKKVRPVLVTPSGWLFNVAQNSAIGQFAQAIVKIGNPVPEPPKLMTREQAEKRLNLEPTVKKRVLCVAQNLATPRKGFDLLVEGVRSGALDGFSVISVGKSTPELDGAIHQLGYLSDSDDVAAAYAAADVFCLSSIEENLAQTGMESLSLGTPVVCFDNTGPCDYTINGRTGVVVSERSAKALVDGLRQACNTSELLDRQSVQNAFWDLYKCHYSADVILQQYAEVYRGVVASSKV